MLRRRVSLTFLRLEELRFEKLKSSLLVMCADSNDLLYTVFFLTVCV